MQHHDWLRPLARVLLAVYAQSCYHYTTPSDISIDTYIRQKEPNNVRLRLADSSQVMLESPWMTRDSVGGLVKDVDGPWTESGRPPTREEWWSISRAHVMRVEVHRLNAGLTGGLLGFGVLLGVPIVIGLLTCCEISLGQ